jgi:hypothetical protein
MSLALKVLDKVRYSIFLVPIVMLGVVTVPFAIFFNWDGIWILCIMNKEWCSLKEAKRLLKEDIRYQITYDNEEDEEYYKIGSNARNNLKFCNSRDDSFASSAGSYEIYQTSPTYSYLNYNINHSNYDNNHNS